MTTTPPLATGFVAWHPILSRFNVTLSKSSTWEEMLIMEGFLDPRDSFPDSERWFTARDFATQEAEKKGWQIIEVEIFRKQKEGV